MQFIILAAGSSRRFRSKSYNGHKALYRFNQNENFLGRILSQISEYSFVSAYVVTGYKKKLVEATVRNYNNKKFKIIYNKNYKKDKNILSLSLALNRCNNKTPVVIIEADMYLDDMAFKKIYFSSLKNKNYWYVSGNFKRDQVGGILKSKRNFVSEVKIVKKYARKYQFYKKLLGAMTLSSNNLKDIKKCIATELTFGIDNYYLKPIINTLYKRKNYSLDLKRHIAGSFNTGYELHKIIKKINSNTKPKIHFVKTSELRPIENFDKAKITPLLKKIKKDGSWTKPLIIEKKHNLILDGHHRFEIAKKMKLNYLPVIKVSYSKIKVWSLRNSIRLNAKKVIKNVKKSKIYPKKTVKHYFGFLNLDCKYKLNNEKFKKK